MHDVTARRRQSLTTGRNFQFEFLFIENVNRQIEFGELLTEAADVAEAFACASDNNLHETPETINCAWMNCPFVERGALFAINLSALVYF